MPEKVSRKLYQIRLDHMIDSLRKQIHSGEYPGGRFLPSENDLGKTFRLGNNSVRKGLGILASEGLIEKIPRVGNRVPDTLRQRDVVLTFGYHLSLVQSAAMERLLAEFQRLYPYIKVQTIVFPSREMMSFVTDSLKSGMMDVVTINNNQFEQLAENEQLDLLQPMDVRKAMYPFVVEPFRKKEELWVQPFIFSPVVLCYNRQHYLERNVPEPQLGWSWEDLFRHAQQVSIKNERFGLSFHLMSQHRWPVFMLQSGMTFRPLDQDRSSLSGSPLIKSFGICRELIAMPGVFPAMAPEGDSDVTELFIDGKVSTIMTTYNGLNGIKNANLLFEIAPLPRYIDNSTLLVVIGLAVNSKSPVKEEAKLLVDFLASYASQLTIRQRTLSIPADRNAAEWQGEEEIYRPAGFHMYREQVHNFREVKDLRLNNRELQALQKEARLFWTGLQDEQSLCEKIEELLYEYQH